MDVWAVLDCDYCLFITRRALTDHDASMNNDKSTSPANAHVLVRDPANGPMLNPLTLGDILSLGRAPGNTIVLHDERASRNHAEIRVNEDGKWDVRDLKSRNGTTVNGNEITSEHTLTDGDTIQIGSTTILFCERTTSFSIRSERI